LLKELFLRSLLLVLFTAGSLESAMAQTLNYQDIFGNDWQKALTFVETNNKWIKPVLAKYKISYPLALAIVFPELVRYSALRDKMEITLLKALYTNLGEDYANFSIGPFQMKPSFAELIREKAPQAMGRKTKTLFKDISEYDNIAQYRAAIIKELEDPVTELNYLVAFIKICESTLNNKEWSDEKSKVKFLSTAYNYGINKTPEEIAGMTDKKFFNTKLYKTTNYCYSEVALFWYNQYADKEKISATVLNKTKSTYPEN
jgi:hypothetical protein